MKLGAQFYSIRTKSTTPEEVKRSFKVMKEIGYSVAQMSGICPMEPELLRDYSLEYDLPIVCTHSKPERILADTDALIKEHKIYNCDTIGFGSMPGTYERTVEGVRRFIKDIELPIKKALDAGMRITYHNHAFEFNDIGGVKMMDLLIEEAPQLNFILDTYWVKFGGCDYFSYIKKIGGERMVNIHFKDMAYDPNGPMCPCGEGTINFAPIVKLCESLGIKNALVEQDNADKAEDPYEEMRTSFNNLKTLF